MSMVVCVSIKDHVLSFRVVLWLTILKLIQAFIYSWRMCFDVTKIGMMQYDIARAAGCKV